jgi:hypothetical protein
MALKGKGFMTVWQDIKSEAERQIAATNVVRLQEPAVYDRAYVLEQEEL